jgi:hypothetical protein
MEGKRMKATTTENDKATKWPLREEFSLFRVVLLTRWSGLIGKWTEPNIRKLEPEAVQFITKPYKFKLVLIRYYLAALYISD